MGRSIHYSDSSEFGLDRSFWSLKHKEDKNGLLSVLDSTLKTYTLLPFNDFFSQNADFQNCNQYVPIVCGKLNLTIKLLEREVTKWNMVIVKSFLTPDPVSIDFGYYCYTIFFILFLCLSLSLSIVLSISFYV